MTQPSNNKYFDIPAIVEVFKRGSSGMSSILVSHEGGLDHPIHWGCILEIRDRCLKEDRPFLCPRCGEEEPFFRPIECLSKPLSPLTLRIEEAARGRMQ